jgi:hypothetical protein
MLLYGRWSVESLIDWSTASWESGVKGYEAIVGRVQKTSPEGKALDDLRLLAEVGRGPICNDVLLGFSVDLIDGDWRS